MQNVNLLDKLEDLELYMATSKLSMADEINHLSEEVKFYRHELVNVKLAYTDLQYTLDCNRSNVGGTSGMLKGLFNKH